jgi:hypothetical protein
MGKATFVRSDDKIVNISSGISEDMFNDGKRARYEFGAGIIFNLNGSYFEKKFTYQTQLELFSNYFDKPQNVDVVWDFQSRIALTKHVSAGLRINMIYYDNQKTIVKEKYIDPSDGLEKTRNVTRGAQLQMKEYFEIGLFYAF